MVTEDAPSFLPGSAANLELASLQSPTERSVHQELNDQSSCNRCDGKSKMGQNFAPLMCIVVCCLPVSVVKTSYNPAHDILYKRETFLNNNWSKITDLKPRPGLPIGRMRILRMCPHARRASGATWSAEQPLILSI